jgi:leucyl aminopeptidase (aminopeptidase T)
MPSIARSVVSECLRAKPGEAVTVSTYPHTIDLANEIGAELYKAGAEPLLLLDTDEFFYAQFKHLSEDQLKQPSPHCLGLAEYATANIYLGGPRDPSGMRRVPSSKWSAYNEGEVAHYEKSLQKKTRSLSVPLGTITRERAKTYGFNYNTWKRSFEDGLKVKYADIQRYGKMVGALLALPQRVRITAPNGTDLRFQLARREAQVNDGIIDDADLMAGANEASLPAGSVTVAPQEDSASGVFVGDTPIPLQGKLLEGLEFRFESGRIAEITGRRNANLVTEQYEAGTGDKDRLGALAIGLNRKLRPGFLTSAYAAGVVTVGIGDNRSLGGANKSNWGFFDFVANATLKVGDKTIVEGGKLTV